MCKGTKAPAAGAAAACASTEARENKVCEAALSEHPGRTAEPVVDVQALWVLHRRLLRAPTGQLDLLALLPPGQTSWGFIHCKAAAKSKLIALGGDPRLKEIIRALGR